MTSTNTQKLATEVDRVIGSRIAALRVAKGLTQAMLGHAIGVSFQQVQKYEKGRNRVGASRLQRIADQLGVPVETFFASSHRDDGREVGVPIFLDDPNVLELILAFTSIADVTKRADVLYVVKTEAAIQ
jgi:transcriptional regulator with XRE-family HTH domain